MLGGNMMLEAILPVLMFVLLLALIFLRIPVFVALFLTAIIFGSLLWGIEQALSTAFNGLWSVMNNWGLVAMPLFVFTASLLEASGIVDDMYKTFYMWLGRLRGSLYIITMALGSVIGAMTGVVAAGVSTLTLIIYPQMLKFKYPKRLSMGITMFAGTLPQLIPPSLNMVVYGMTIGVSVARMFAGGIGLGIVMTVAGIVYSLIWCQLHKDLIPIVDVQIKLKEKVSALVGIIPPVVIILGILGSLFAGIATPTEASGVGALLVLLYSIITRRLTWKGLMKALRDALIVTTMYCWIASGGLTFGAVFSACGGRQLFSSVLLSLPYPQYTAIAVSVALLFILGMFLDTITIIIVFGSILAPIIHGLGYDPVWWGVIFCTALIASYLTPPVAPAIYYFKSLRPEEPMDEIIRAVIPFTLLVAITVIIGIIFPETVMFFIRLFYKG